MADPSGITVAHPTSSSLLANTGSACIYGNTTNPSATNCSAACNVPIGSGNKYFGSGITSNFTQFVRPIDLANLAVVIASSALALPAVFGKI